MPFAEERIRYAGERDDFHSFFDLTPSAWRILARNFGDAIEHLRAEAPISTLDASQWAVLIQIVQALLGDHRPTQAELAVHAGISVRTVRRSLSELEGLGLLRGARGNGSAIELGLGDRLVQLLREFVFPRDPKHWRHRCLPAQASVAPPDIQTHGSPGTADSQTYGPYAPQDIQTHGSRTTTDSQTQVHVEPREDEAGSPQRLTTGIPHNLKQFEPSPLSPASLRTAPSNVVAPGPDPSL